MGYYGGKSPKRISGKVYDSNSSVGSASSVLISNSSGQVVWNPPKNLTGIVTSIVAGTNITVSGSTGSVTINATSGGSISGINTTDTSFFNQINATGVITASSFSGDGSGLTGVTAASGVSVLDDNSVIGTASTINFGDNLSVSPLSAGIVTVTGSAGGGGGENYWASTLVGIHTLSNVGIGTTNPIADVKASNTSVLAAGIVTAYKFYGDGSGLTGVSGGSGYWDSVTLPNGKLGTQVNGNISVGIGTTAISSYSLTVTGFGNTGGLKVVTLGSANAIEVFDQNDPDTSTFFVDGTGAVTCENSFTASGGVTVNSGTLAVNSGTVQLNGTSVLNLASTGTFNQVSLQVTDTYVGGSAQYGYLRSHGFEWPHNLFIGENSQTGSRAGFVTFRSQYNFFSHTSGITTIRNTRIGFGNTALIVNDGIGLQADAMFVRGDADFTGIVTSLRTVFARDMSISGIFTGAYGNSSSTTDANQTIDGRQVTFFSWQQSASSATRTITVNNLSPGNEVRIYCRNTFGGAKIVLLRASASTAGHQAINFATSSGGVGSTSVTLGASAGTAVVSIFNANGNFVGSIS